MSTTATPPVAEVSMTRLRRLARFAHPDQLYFALAIVIGIVAGLAVVAFRSLIVILEHDLLGPVAGRPVARTLMVPTGVGLLIGVLVVRGFPRARGSGVNQTKAALYIYDGYIAFKTVVGKFLTAALAIGSGQSLGPEDPSLQVGAGIASLIGRHLKLSRARQRLLAPLGAAAGLAAAFNAPISAVLFVIEEVIGRWSSGVIGAVVLAAVSSTMVARWFFGDHPLFAVPHFQLRGPLELVAYAVLGVAGGWISLVFVKLVAWLRPRLLGLPAAAQYFLPAAAGLLIGVIAIWYPQVMSAGYDAINQAMSGHVVWTTLAILTGLKIVATAASFSSGTPGGMFAPTLFIGAMLGGAVGGLEHFLLPRVTAAIGVYVLIGMGTAFAGILRCPMTSVFMVVEVSGSYDIVLPLLISNTIAYFISRTWQPVPIFDLLTQQDGLTLPSMEERREEQVLHVEDAMHPLEDFSRGRLAATTAQTDVQQARILADGHNLLLVDGAGGRWYGLTPQVLDELLAQGATDQPLRDFLRPEWRLAPLYPDQPLEVYLRQAGDEPLLPVVHRAHGGLLGVLALTDVLAAYRHSA